MQDSRSGRPAPGARVKADLVRAVLEIVGTEGVESASVDRIASVAGMSRGTIYAHYPDGRDDLIFQAYSEVGSSLVAEAVREAAKADTWIGRIEAYARVVLNLSADTKLGRFYNLEGPYLLRSRSIGIGSRAYHEAFVVELGKAFDEPDLKREMNLDAIADLLVGALREAGTRVAADLGKAPAMLRSFMVLVSGLVRDPRSP